MDGSRPVHHPNCHEMPMNLDDARLALADLRRAFVEAWRFSHENYLHGGQNFFVNRRAEMPDPLCTDMCRHTSYALQHLLAAAGDPGWRPAGGFLRARTDRPDLAGQRDSFGEWVCDTDGILWLQHWWLEKDGMRLDLTAEAMGWDAVYLDAADDPRYQVDPQRSRQKYLSSVGKTIRHRWLAPPPEQPGWSCDPREFQVRTVMSAAAAEFTVLWQQALARSPFDPDPSP